MYVKTIDKVAKNQFESQQQSEKTKFFRKIQNNNRKNFNLHVSHSLGSNTRKTLSIIMKQRTYFVPNSIIKRLIVAIDSSACTLQSAPFVLLNYLLTILPKFSKKKRDISISSNFLPAFIYTSRDSKSNRSHKHQTAKVYACLDDKLITLKVSSQF